MVTVTELGAESITAGAFRLASQGIWMGVFKIVWDNFELLSTFVTFPIKLGTIFAD